MEPVYPAGRLRPPPFRDLSHTFQANSASYLKPISFHAAEPSWTTAKRNASHNFHHFCLTGSSTAAILHASSVVSSLSLVPHRLHSASAPLAAARNWHSSHARVMSQQTADGTRRSQLLKT